MRMNFGLMAVALSGAALLGSTQVYAGADEAHQDSFWSTQSVQDPAYAHHGAYLQVEPRDSKVSPQASSGVNQADETNPYINHAMGTMSGPEAVAQSRSPAASNGNYTASYQHYMQVEPRDAQVAKPAQGSGNPNDIYFYHSMGTMAHP